MSDFPGHLESEKMIGDPADKPDSVITDGLPVPPIYGLYVVVRFAHHERPAGEVAKFLKQVRMLSGPLEVGFLVDWLTTVEILAQSNDDR